MKDKCQKYEGLFVFSDEATLESHIKECPDCRAEHEKMSKVSKLLQEVKPYYIAQRKKKAQMKIACAISFMFLSGTVLGLVNLNPDISDTLRYGTVLEAQDYGFPVDDYGFLLVE